MALMLNGATNWPDRKALTRLGQTRPRLQKNQQASSQICPIMQS
jgi:hypothetical protein